MSSMRASAMHAVLTLVAIVGACATKTPDRSRREGNNMMRYLLFGWALLLMVGIPHGQAYAQKAQPQSCEQSRIATPTGMGEPACFVSEYSAGNGKCTVQVSSVRLKKPTGPTPNFLFMLHEPRPQPDCYMISLKPEEEIEQLKPVDPVMKGAGNWSAPKRIDGTTVAQFTNQAGKHCFAFHRNGSWLGARQGGGYTYHLRGFYCEPLPAAAQPMSDEQIATYLAQARPN